MEPTLGVRTCIITVDDGTDTSAPIYTAVTIALVNDNAPVLTVNDSYVPILVESGLYPESTVALFDGNMVLSDADHNPEFLLDYAVVRVNPATPQLVDEYLRVSFPTSLTVTYNASTGVLLLLGQQTVQDYQFALDHVEYVTTNDEPDPNDRSIEVYVFDGRHASNTVVVNVSVELIDDQYPIVDLDASVNSTVDYHVNFVEEGPAVEVTSPNLVLRDRDSGFLYQFPTNITEAIVTLVDRRDGPNEYLTVTAPAGFAVTASETVSARHRLRRDEGGFMAEQHHRWRRQLRENCTDVQLQDSVIPGNPVHGIYVQRAGTEAGRPAYESDTGLFLYFSPPIAGGSWVIGTTLGSTSAATMRAYLPEDIADPIEQSMPFRSLDGTRWIYDWDLQVACVTPTTTMTTTGTTTVTTTATTSQTTSQTSTATTTQTTTPSEAPTIDPTTTFELRITGAGTLEDYRRILRTVLYHNIADEPLGPRTRTVEFIIKDSVHETIPPAATRITIVSVNDAPRLNLSAVLTGIDNYVNYTEGDVVRIAPTAGIEDDDDVYIQELRLVLLSPPDGIVLCTNLWVVVFVQWSFMQLISIAKSSLGQSRYILVTLFCSCRAASGMYKPNEMTPLGKCSLFDVAAYSPHRRRGEHFPKRDVATNHGQQQPPRNCTDWTCVHRKLHLLATARGVHQCSLAGQSIDSNACHQRSDFRWSQHQCYGVCAHTIRRGEQRTNRRPERTRRRWCQQLAHLYGARDSISDRATSPSL